MTARERFQIGDRVRLSAYGREQFSRICGMGTVVRFHPEDPEVIRIRVGNNKTLTTYHMTFWEPDTEA